MSGSTKRKPIVDVRKFSTAVYPARPVYQHGHFCVRAFHLLLSYPGYSLLACFLIYIQIMELKLYSNIRAREPFDMGSTATAGNQSSGIHIFDPLPVKKIMVEPLVSRLTCSPLSIRCPPLNRSITFARR